MTLRHWNANALAWQMLRVFLARRVKVFRTLCTVSVVFNTETEAELFRRHLLKRGVRQ